MSTSTSSARRSSATTRRTRRFARIGLRLARPDVDCVSVKISALCANLDVLAFDHSVERIAERLRPLFRRGQRVRRRRSSSTSTWRSTGTCELTRGRLPAGARRTRARAPPGRRRAAGLPPRLPRRARRTDRVGPPAAGRRWRVDHGPAGQGRQPRRWSRSRPSWRVGRRRRTRPSPTSTPASRRCSTARSRRRQWRLRVGVASHNLFDVAWALTLRDERGCDERVEIEMLEGMAPAQARAARAEAGGLLLYTPVVAADRLRGQHRLPVAPARRERRAGELPAGAVLAHARVAGVGRGARAVRDRGGARHDGLDVPRRTQDRRSNGARSIPTRRSPTSPTPTSPWPPTAPGSHGHLAVDASPAAPAAGHDDHGGIDAVGGAGRRAPPRGRRRRPTSGASVLSPRGRGDGRGPRAHASR